ncbi:chain-length determining protein, partial [bacterium LRH843]|nr:chain-length determining protein [bacterium LRH843]
LIQLQTQRERIRAEDLERQTNLLRKQKLLLQERIQIVQTALNVAPEIERQINAMERRLGQLQDELSVITTRRADAAM